MAYILEKLCALSYSLDDLRRVEFSISRQPREEQAQFADGICRAFASNTPWVEGQIDGWGPSYESWNTTSVGNLAYLLLHADVSQDRRQKLEQLLDGYAKWCEQQNGQTAQYE